MTSLFKSRTKLNIIQHKCAEEFHTSDSVDSTSPPILHGGPPIIVKIKISPLLLGLGGRYLQGVWGSQGCTCGGALELWGQSPLSPHGVIWKFEYVKKIFIKRFSTSPPPTGSRVGPYQNHIPTTPHGGNVWELCAPKWPIFVNYILRILQDVLLFFGVTSQIDSSSTEASFSRKILGVRAAEHPQNRPTRTSRFSHAFLTP